jgi:hypothetical protein
VIVCGVLSYMIYYRWIFASGLFYYNFMDPRWGLTIVMEVAVDVNLLVTEAAFVWWQANQLTVFFVPDNSTWLADFMSGVTVLLVTIMTSFTPGTVMAVLNFISLVPRTLLLYCVPSLFFLKFFGFRSLWSVLAIAALLFGVVIAVASLYWGMQGCLVAFAA